MNLIAFQNQFTEFFLKEKPFIFVIDFEMKHPFICSLEEAEEQGIYYDFHGKTNHPSPEINKDFEFNFSPIEKEKYFRKIERVKQELNEGNTYLLNLTFQTPISTNLSLLEIFHLSKAPYKIYFKDEFVSFSPEIFVRLEDEKIFTFPMKGTIDATIPNAEELLLSNQKEQWEHTTIVDLLRNDLSIIAHHIEVLRYRYIEKVKTHRNEILQTSSEIMGHLHENWRETIGHDFLKLLPAGSITGAPKKKTIELIREIEGRERGYYTGVFGIFDGQNLDSSVCIRFIEKENKLLFYRSGGGITSSSSSEEEYNEFLQKIYIPIK